MSRAACLACFAAAALALTGCEEKKDAPPAAPAGTQAAPAATPAAANQGDVPTEQDFEEEAEKEITAANLDSELDKLDKEIGQ